MIVYTPRISHGHGPRPRRHHRFPFPFFPLFPLTVVCNTARNPLPTSDVTGANIPDVTANLPVSGFPFFAEGLGSFGGPT